MSAIERMPPTGFSEPMPVGDLVQYPRGEIGEVVADLRPGAWYDANPSNIFGPVWERRETGLAPHDMRAPAMVRFPSRGDVVCDLALMVTPNASLTGVPASSARPG